MRRRPAPRRSLLEAPGRGRWPHHTTTPHRERDEKSAATVESSPGAMRSLTGSSPSTASRPHEPQPDDRQDPSGDQRAREGERLVGQGDLMTALRHADTHERGSEHLGRHLDAVDRRREPGIERDLEQDRPRRARDRRCRRTCRPAGSAAALSTSPARSGEFVRTQGRLGSRRGAERDGGQVAPGEQTGVEDRSGLLTQVPAIGSHGRDRVDDLQVVARPPSRTARAGPPEPPVGRRGAGGSAAGSRTGHRRAGGDRADVPSNRYSAGDAIDHVGRVNPMASTCRLRSAANDGTCPMRYRDAAGPRISEKIRPGSPDRARSTSASNPTPSVASNAACSSIQRAPCRSYRNRSITAGADNRAARTATTATAIAGERRRDGVQRSTNRDARTARRVRPVPAR